MRPLTALSTVPAVLAALVLGAHFLRAGRVVLVAACLGCIVLFFLRARWALLVSRAFLLGAAAVWTYTAGVLAQARAAAGMPSARMQAILLGVAAFSALSAWVLPSRHDRPPPA
jgi:hypothetical protein